MRKIIFMGLIGLSILSCSNDDENDDGGAISDQNLSGIVQGKSFTFRGGQAFETTTFDDEPGISINLTDFAADCSDDIFDFELEISAIVPNEVGVYNDINIVTQDGDDLPFNNLDRTVEITAVSETEISGKMKLVRPESSIAPEDNFEGAFTLSICQ